MFDNETGKKILFGPTQYLNKYKSETQKWNTKNETQKQNTKAKYKSKTQQRNTEAKHKSETQKRNTKAKRKMETHVMSRNTSELSLRLKIICQISG